MKKLRTVIVDDEELARRLLHSSLSKISEIEIIAECKNGREAVKCIQDLAPDLVFLDIQMPGLNGFDVVKALQADVVPLVVFCTAFEQFAIDAFDLHAVDYLLKPFDQNRLLRAVQRARDRIDSDENSLDHKAPLIGAIDEIAHRVTDGCEPRKDNASERSSQPKKIAIKESDGTKLINVEDIDWVDAAGDYMCVHVAGTTHILRSTMKELLDKLDAKLFARVHRSTIVNMERIVSVKSHTKGEYFLDLDCGERLKVSRNFRDSIKQFLRES